MPDFEFEFNQQDKDLVITQDSATFGNPLDYIRLTIYPTEAIDTIVDLPDDTKGIDGQAIFFSTLEGIQDINISPFTDSNNNTDTNFFKTIGTTGENDFQIYQNGDDIYIKPNEIFNTFELPQGDYKIQIDFLNQELPNQPFLIKQVSTSRKEVRIKILGESITRDSEILASLTQAFNGDTDKYQFKHILNIGTGDHIPIMNYQFDGVTDGKENQSIILKLYDALPTNVGNLSMVTIEREVLTTQIQNIFYFSDVPDVFFGDGLIPQPQEDWINPDGNNIDFQNYDEISSSIDDITLDNLVSQSLYNYPNLNTDFRFFENHTFFGSAKTKLENFNSKIKTIQGFYSEISSSLSISESVSADFVPLGSSTYTVQLRKNLFKKINNEIKTFTPYETFLYYDGQNKSTASAPGLGKNYADTIPVTQQVNTGEAITLNGFDGFDVVYQHSDKRLDTGTGAISDDHIDLFTDKYQVHEAPFFNHSGSIYLSFLIKANTSASIQGPLNNENSRKIKLGGDETIPLPFGSFNSTTGSQPYNAFTTASSYRRFIFKVSASYWVPTNVVNDDNVNINFDINKIDNFSVGSNQIQILEDDVSFKTGSNAIKDSSGKYPTTVITGSGIPFKGSCMPAGELFRINIPANYDSDTIFTQSFITNVNVTFNDPVDVLPFDIVAHTGSTTWTNWYNGMVDSASTFDTDNIHSFENNLPLYIQESSDYKDMKDFLNLQGEQYDLIRNHIDSMGTIHKRGYKKTNSPPNNTLPMLLQNMGWEVINPFSGNLTETLGSYLTNVTSIDDIKTNTWRKTLNNLLYIYKSKGTKNSVRALLNTYGYPPDILEFQEFGGSTEESNPRIFINNPPSDSGIDLSLESGTGSFSYTSNKRKLYRYSFNENNKRTLNLNWWMNSADLNTIEFVYKHSKTTNTQELLQSSGSRALQSTGSIQILSGNPSHFDGKLLRITSSDGTRKTYIFDDDADGATGTLDGSGRVRIQTQGLVNRDEIATEISTSISHPNGHFNKIDISDSIQFLTNTGQNFITSDGDTLFANSSGSMVLTQITASVDGNTLITTNAPSMSVSKFAGGSDKQTLWNLRLIPDNEGISSSFEFRLNNTSHASSSITASNALSMSTSYSTMTDGQLWNVMLQRVSSSVSGSGTQEYRLYAGLQKGKTIDTLNYISMSVSGGLTVDSNNHANQNWVSTGSRNHSSSSNLVVGETVSGSISQIKGWGTTLSASKFRQHILNKFSTVGNSITAHKDELIYHFKLNENYSSASVSSSTQTLNIVDSAPTTTYSDYSFTKPGTTFNTSSVYGIDLIEVVKLTLQDNTSKANDNNILINPRRNVVSDLSPIQSAVKPLESANSKPLFNTSAKLELYRSPQTFVDNFILDTLSGYNFETLYGNPQNYYSQSYDEFDTFREEFFEAHPISVDTNKFIRAHENMFNHSITEAMKSVVPARSTFSDKNSNFGVEVRPTILEKQKYNNKTGSIEINPNTATGSHNVNIKLSDSLFGKEILSTFESIKVGEVFKPTSASGSLELPISTSISLGNSYVTSSGYLKNAPAKNHFHPPFLQPGGYSASLEHPNFKTGSINILSVKKTILSSSGQVLRYDDSDGISFSDSTVVLTKDGTIDYASIANESFVNIHDSWGTSDSSGSDTHFINYAGGTGSRGDYNVGHIDTRNHFYSIGDNEYYSASYDNASSFEDYTRFYSRLYITDDFHSSANYDGKSFGTGSGIITGRMMGKTRYFTTSSVGEIILPSNHVTKFSQPFKERMNNGTQNTGSGLFNGNQIDYSSASFYRIKVTGGENELRVQSGTPSSGPNNKIIYNR